MYMIFWIIQRVIVSLVLILCAHYIYIFLKNNLTSPKTRDLVNLPREKYKEMYEKINQSDDIKNNDTDSSNNTRSQSKMKDELKNYLKDLKKSSSNNGLSVNNDNLPASNNNDSFSNSFSDAGYSAY
jgi:hypothetical protein